MAVLNSKEFVENYMIGKVFQPDNVTPEIKEALIKSWDILLTHIESNIRVNINTFTFTSIPDIPTAVSSPCSAGFPSGQTLTGTGAVYAQTFYAAIIAPTGNTPLEQVPIIITNVTKVHDALFAHIAKNATVNITGIKTTGTVTFPGGSFPYTATSSTPATGTLL